MSLHCPSCGVPVELVTAGDGGAHWYKARAEVQGGRLRYTERQMYDQAAWVSSRPGQYGVMAAQLAEHLLVVLERIARLRAKPAVRALDDTVETER